MDQNPSHGSSNIKPQVIVYHGTCAQCNQPLVPEQICFAIGIPYHILLHWRCGPYYPYDSNIYPHEKALSEYKR